MLTELVIREEASLSPVAVATCYYSGEHVAHLPLELYKLYQYAGGWWLFFMGSAGTPSPISKLPSLAILLVDIVRKWGGTREALVAETSTTLGGASTPSATI